MFAISVAVFSFIGSVVIIAMEMNVRYTTNQGFTFLGGGGLEVLIASTFLLILGLALIYRPDRKRKGEE